MTADASIFLDGTWKTSVSAATLAVLDPATGEVAGSVSAGDPADVDAAVAAARSAAPGWAATATDDRARYLKLLRRELVARREQFAAAITGEMGAPIAFSRHVQTGLPLRALGALLAALPEVAGPEQVAESVVLREPVGVVAALTPWNYPLHQVVVKVCAALAVGCTVVLKPSELAPLSARLLVEVTDELGFPPGVLNLVTGRGPVVGDALARHPDVDMVSFTGSTAVGRQVAVAAAGTMKRVVLELGGKSASVVLPDADLDAAVTGTVASCLLNSGQTCTALTRLLVPRSRYAQALEAAAAVMAGYRLGDPRDQATQLGPLVSAAARDRVLAHLERAAAAGIERRGEPVRRDLPAGGSWVAPVVLAVEDPAAPVAREELFGPVLCVLPYPDGDEDAAVELANDSDYGLSGAVWSADTDRALRVAGRLRTGRVDVNGARLNLAAPAGGRRHSGTGSELGRHGLAEFQVLKSVQLPAS